ncbi:hypothetical protein IAU59_002232 [Kwoniella sp. CBS 9459]
MSIRFGGYITAGPSSVRRPQAFVPQHPTPTTSSRLNTSPQTTPSRRTTQSPRVRLNSRNESALSRNGERSGGRQSVDGEVRSGEEGRKPMVRATRNSFLSGLGLGVKREKSASQPDSEPQSAQQVHLAQRPAMESFRRAKTDESSIGASPRGKDQETDANGTLPQRDIVLERRVQDDPRSMRMVNSAQRQFRSQNREGRNQLSSSIPQPPSQFDDSRVHFIGIDLESSLSRIYSHKLPVFRSPSFNMRAFPSAFLPPRRSIPFPTGRNTEYRKERLCVYLGLMSSKAAVSKLAVERNTCRRRVKTALEEVVNGRKDLHGLSRDERMRLVTPEYAYIISLTADSHDAPYDSLKSDILNSLKFLKNAQSRKWSETARLPAPKYIPKTQLESPTYGVDLGVKMDLGG